MKPVRNQKAAAGGVAADTEGADTAVGAADDGTKKESEGFLELSVNLGKETFIFAWREVLRGGILGRTTPGLRMVMSFSSFLMVLASFATANQTTDRRRSVTDDSLKSRLFPVTVSLLFLALSGCSSLPLTEVDCSGFAYTPERDESSPPDDSQVIDTETAERMIIRKVYPKYPDLAVRAGLDGKVWVKLWIGQDGIVKQATVLRSNAEIFNESSLEAARQLLFSPASCGGRAIAVWATIPMRFKIAVSR